MALLLALVIVLGTGGQDPRPQPRDPLRKLPGAPATASISGRVVDAESGRPVADALIRTAAPFGNVAQRVEAITDLDGRYELTGLAPGEYVIVALPHQNRAVHGSAGFGMAEATAATVTNAPRVAIAQAEARTGIDIRLPRARAIEGRVSNSAGEPLSGLSVRAERLGVRSDVRNAATDDRGLYRIYGLSPGSYRVCADVPRAARDPGAPPQPAFVTTCYSTGPLDARQDSVVVEGRDAEGADIQMERTGTSVPLRSGSGDATLAGRLTETSTGLPLAGAPVVVRSFHDSTAVFTTKTDSDGRYEAAGLPAGVWIVRAEAGEHRASHVPKGYSRSGLVEGASGIKIDAGERRTDIDIALPAAGTISGRVVDEAGEPVAGIRLQLFRAPGGRAVYFGDASSDDRGEFRLFGIEPGSYFVCAEPAMVVRLRSTGAGVRRRVPADACHLSATGGEFGQAITVVPGDTGGVEIRTPFLRTRQIGGTVRSADGSPARGARISARLSSSRGRSGIEVPADGEGRFSFVELPPARYTLSARWTDPAPVGEGEWALLDVDLSSDDATGILVQLAAPVTVRGRITYDGQEPPGTPSPVVAVESAAPGIFPAHTSKPNLTEDLRFEISERMGPQVITVERLPAGWVVERITYRGANIAGLPATFVPGTDEVQIVLGNRPAVVRGRVLDARGDPVGSAVVLVVPADRIHLPGRHAWPMTLSDADGTFTAPAVPAGEYLVLALTQRDFHDLADHPPAGLLTSLAERVVLRENERRTVELVK